METRERMSRSDRRQRILRIAAEEFASGGLHGTSTETIARRADITQAYVFRIFGSKKALFLELVTGAFDRVAEGMRTAAGAETGLEALAKMGSRYNELLADRNTLLLQLQGLPPAATRRSATRYGPASPGCGRQSPKQPGLTQ